MLTKAEISMRDNISVSFELEIYQRFVVEYENKLMVVFQMIFQNNATKYELSETSQDRITNSYKVAS